MQWHSKVLIIIFTYVFLFAPDRALRKSLQGRNVILDQTYGAPRITKDGVSVAKEIEFKDRSINLGAQLVRSGESFTKMVLIQRIH